MRVTAKRLSDQPIIHAQMDAHSDNRIGSNICGPSLIPCPHWVENPLAAYYLYFADRVVNELRDPRLYADGDRVYLLYCGGGVAGIGLTALNL